MTVWKIALGVLIGIVGAGIVGVIAVYGLGALASTDDGLDACVEQHEDYLAGDRSSVDPECL